MLLDKIKMEFIGTFFFVYLTSMAVINFFIDSINQLSLMIAFFLLYTALLWVSKHNCESHFNPAITLAHVFTKRTKIFTGISYLFIQSIATFCAASLIKISIPVDVHDKIINEKSSIFFSPSEGKLLLIFNEGIASFFLVFCFTTLLWDNQLNQQVFAPGTSAINAALTFFYIQKTGASINPLRAFAGSLISRKFGLLGYYLVANIVGGVIGGILGILFSSETKRNRKMKQKKIHDRRKTKRVLDELDRNLIK